MPQLGSLTVSRQGFGAMGLSGIYGKAEDEASIRTIHRAIDLGIAFLDTATLYGEGHNETLLGRAVAGRREGLAIASKFRHHPHGPDKPRVSARDAVEASLARLGLDHIDLYYLHRVDPVVPIEDSVGELGRLVQEGKIGAVGVSETTADELGRACAAHPVAALQSEYSLWTRGVEAQILPAARALGVGFVAYSPLGRGFLAGSDVVEPEDKRRFLPRFQPEAVAANARRRETIQKIAGRLGASLAQVSLAWVLAKDVVPIPGTRHIAHLEANWAANRLVLDEAAMAELEAVFTPGSTVGERYPAEAAKLVPQEPVSAA